MASPPPKLVVSASDQALSRMDAVSLTPLHLSKEHPTHSPSTSTRLRQGEASPVVRERKVSEHDFADVRRLEMLRPRRSTDDSGLRPIGPSQGSRNGNNSASPQGSPLSLHRVSSGGSSSPDSKVLVDGTMCRSPVRRHSISSASTIVRYVEWTPEDSDSRRRGRRDQPADCRAPRSIGVMRRARLARQAGRGIRAQR